MDPARGVLRLLERFCEEEPPSFQWQRLREAEEFSKLALGILQHTSNASSIWCTNCDSPHSVSVEFKGDAAYRAYCQDVGFFGVDPEDLRVLELDLAALTAQIGRGLQIPPVISAEEVVPRLLYRVGSPKFGPYRTRVYFARCLDRVAYFAQVRLTLEQHRDHTPVILVSTTSWQRIHHEMPARHALLSLSDVAELRGQRLKFNDEAFLTKLREDVVPEPEFKGAHHLPATAIRSVIEPATAIRSVIEQLYALPTMVSYDLRQVSEALKAAGQIEAAYAPVGTFRRDFSSLLAMEAIRSLREGQRDAITIAEVEEDVRARLDTAARLVDWLTNQNAAAQTPFLRLEKQPFRFQSTLNPLNAGDLDLLHAYELLDSRSVLLETLVRLAQPARVRQQRGECLAGLTLEREGRHGNGRRWLQFSIPPESRDAEISPDDIGLILTDDNPDLRLNPANWRPLEIRFNYGDYGTLFVNMSARQYDSSIMASLRRQTGPKGWCIDKTHRDINGPRVQNFLLQLGGQP